MNFVRLIVFSLVLMAMALPVLAHDAGPPTVANIEFKAVSNETTSFDGTTSLDGGAFVMALPVPGGITAPSAATDALANHDAYFGLYDYIEDCEVTATARNGTPEDYPGSYWTSNVATLRPAANDTQRRDFLIVTGRLVIWEL